MSAVNALAAIADLDVIGVDVVGLAKSGISASTLPRLLKLFADVKALAAVIPAAEAELQSLTWADDEQLFLGVLQGVKDVLASLAVA